MPRRKAETAANKFLARVQTLERSEIIRVEGRAMGPFQTEIHLLHVEPRTDLDLTNPTVRRCLQELQTTITDIAVNDFHGVKEHPWESNESNGATALYVYTIFRVS